MNCPKIYLFYCTRTRGIICRLFINASVLLRFDHARVTDYELKTFKNTKEHFVSVLLLDHCFLNVKKVCPLLFK